VCWRLALSAAGVGVVVGFSSIVCRVALALLRSAALLQGQGGRPDESDLAFLASGASLVGSATIALTVLAHEMILGDDAPSLRELLEP
jgi:hypothetical protein